MRPFDGTSGGNESAGVASLRDWMIRRVAAEARLEPAHVDPLASFRSLGLDSVTSVSLTCELEKLLGRRVPSNLLSEFDTIEDLVNHLEPAAGGAAGRGWGEAREAACPPADIRDWTDPLTRRVEGWKASGTFFYEPVISSLDGAWADVDGRGMLLMASYCYLGLGKHPRINNAARAALDRYGSGSHGARLLGGTNTLHKELEARIARFTETEAAVVFTTGFMTNVACLGTLVGPDDSILADAYVHASLVDGCRQSGAAVSLFTHNDMEDLEARLRAAAGFKKLVVVDAVYSMDGDIAPLPRLVELCRSYGALLMVDEAHAIGVLGRTGRGLPEHFDMPPGCIDIRMGTLSKTIPSMGGYIAGSRELITALKFNARGWIFSAALPPPQTAAASAALDVMLDEPQRVDRLRGNTLRYVQGLRRQGFHVHDGQTPIVPLACRDEAAAFAFTRGCLEEGLLVFPIVYPAVPADQPRIRTTVTAAHTEEDIDFAVAALGRVGNRTGVAG
ncbi:MAG: hypothetical protein AMXMBFR13_04140 [Phycisphaerae bacterium]